MKKRGDRREGNVLRAVAAIALFFGGVGFGTRRILVLSGLADGSWLSVVGFLFLAYCCLRLALSGLLASRPSRAAEELYLRKTCRGAALVTGATSGLGLAFARGLCERGCRVVLVSRDARKLAEVEAQLKAAGGRCSSVKYDFLTDDDDFYDRVLPEALEGVGLVVNNVGLGTEDPLAIDEVQKYSAMIGVNCGATTRMCQVALPVLAENGGVVVNVSSGSAMQPTPYLAVYAATKAFVAHLSRSLDREWRHRGVRVLCCAPYYISGTSLYKGKSSRIAPSAKVVVDGTVNTLARQSLEHVELTNTNTAHSVLGFLLGVVAEDRALSWIFSPIAKRIGLNASMLQIMAKARARFLAKKQESASSS